MATRRATAEDMRDTGRMCIYCPRLLDVLIWHGGPRSCDHCAQLQPVTLRFKFERSVWWVQFLNPKSYLPLAPPLRFQEPTKIRELVGRTPTRWTLGERQAFEYGLVTGDGRCDIQLTMKQLKALRERPTMDGRDNV
jgi:hypothetical protein